MRKTREPGGRFKNAWERTYIHTIIRAVMLSTPSRILSWICQKLGAAMAERGELLRGLRQAKAFNDELAKVRRRFSRIVAAVSAATHESGGVR